MDSLWSQVSSILHPSASISSLSSNPFSLVYQYAILPSIYIYIFISLHYAHTSPSKERQLRFVGVVPIVSPRDVQKLVTVQRDVFSLG